MGRIQAKWLTHKFEINSKQIKGLEDLNLAAALKYETQEVKGGKDKILDKGLEPENIPLSYTPAKAVGSDPRAEYDGWRKDLGKSGALYLGGKRWGKDKFILTKANLSTNFMNNSGSIQLAKINLNFTEDYLTAVVKQAEKSETKTTTSAVSVGPTKAEKKKKIGMGDFTNVEKW